MKLLAKFRDEKEFMVHTCEWVGRKEGEDDEEHVQVWGPFREGRDRPRMYDIEYGSILAISQYLVYKYISMKAIVVFLVLQQKDVVSTWS